MPATDADPTPSDPTPSDLAALRARASEELGALLNLRTPATRATVLGAGRDDLEEGRRWLERLAPGGWMTPGWPRSEGGMGLGRAGAEVVAEVLDRFERPDLYPFMVGLDLIGPTILRHGTPAQAARWLPPIRSGAEIWCQLFSEPDAGSDLANLKTRAVRDGDHWRVNGSKVWTSRGHYSQWGLLLARTDTSVPKHAGITAFGLDMRRPGVSVRALVQMNGDAHFNEVFLDDVIVADDDRLDDVGRGWSVTITCLSEERGALAGGLGVGIDQVLRLGAVVADDPVRRDRLTRILAERRIIGWSAQRALAERRAGREVAAAGSIAKLASNAMVKAVSALGLESEGPAATAGAPGDGPDEWQTMWQVSPSLSIRGGTDEIQRNIIGERVLGLPREPLIDKDRAFA